MKPENKTVKPYPGIIGAVIAVMLIVSRYLGAAEGAAIGSLNTVTVIVALCLCMHLVRRTSDLTQPHLYSSTFTLVLYALPLATLLATGVQIVLMSTPAFLTSKPFLTVLILLSMPVFLCAYFLYVARTFPTGRSLRAVSVVLLALGCVYVLLRLADAVVLPLIAEAAGKEIAPAVLGVASWNRHLSFVIYIVALFGFIFLHLEIKNETRQDAAQ